MSIYTKDQEQPLSDESVYYMFKELGKGEGRGDLPVRT